MWIIKRSDGLKTEEVQGAHEYMASVHRTLFIYGKIVGLPYRMDAFNASYVADTIWAMGRYDPDKPIKVVIDSEGGFVRDGLAIYDAIKTSPCEVWTFGRMCYSMAAVLLTAGTKGRRYVFPNAHVMLHLPSGQATGDVEQVQIYSEELKKVKETIVDRLIENGVPHSKRKILKDIDREYYMGAQASIDYGLADHVASSEVLYERRPG